MYTLYYVPDWASLAVRLVLEELTVPYEARLVDNSINERDSDEFRRKSPLGLIPVLATEDGEIFETTAILIWLADRHGTLAPAVNSPERASFLKWMLFINSSVHNQILSIFHPEKVSSPDASDQTILFAGRYIDKALSILDSMIASQSPTWLSATQPSIVSYYLALLMRWLNGTESGIRSTNYANIHSILLALENRPAALICANKEGLGRTIFTNPTLL